MIAFYESRGWNWFPLVAYLCQKDAQVMEAAYDRQGVTIWCGNVLDVLRELPDESVHCCVTSPPYFGLRDYGTAQWEGGDAECDHRHDTEHQKQGSTSVRGGRSNVEAQRNENFRDTCRKCGSRRIDQQIGLEKTPAEFIAKLLAVFEEVRRVLRKDGVVFCNMGDSYATGTTSDRKPTQTGKHGYWENPAVNMRIDARDAGFKPKDRMMMPARLAIALCDAGWYLRDEIVWAKPSPMPESVTDRCTKAHEMIYMLTRSPRYFYDREAIAEPCTESNDARPRMGQGPNTQYKQKRRDMPEPNGRPLGEKGEQTPKEVRASGGARMGRGAGWRDDPSTQPTTRTKRSVWTVTSEPFPAAHFATYPKKLVEPMILAGCPETCCAACGAPWVRVVKASGGTIGKGWTDHTRDLSEGTSQTSDIERMGDTPYRRETIGFAPTCTCDAGTVPGLCLDPFIGSGTTAQVARDLGRRCWGIELNPEYVREHCTKRLEQGVLF